MLSDTHTLHYLIVEDIEDVSERLAHEMNAWPHWLLCGKARGVREAKQLITLHQPALLFCDWDLVGGSGFEVLQHVQSIAGYQPFVVFNTGFQSDHPEIAEELVNTYKPDVFVNKPYWKKLKEQLPAIVASAALKQRAQNNLPQPSWITLTNGSRQRLDAARIVCIVQCPQNPRNKLLYLVSETAPLSATLTWKEAALLLEQAGVPHYAVNKRYAIVARPFVQRFHSPYVYLQHGPAKIEVVEEHLKPFEQWLDQGQGNGY